MIRILIVSLIILLPLVRSELKKDKVVIAINCGSNEIYISNKTGITFVADQYYQGGKDSSSGGKYKSLWPKFDDIELYYTERYGINNNLVYELPLPETDRDGHYVLVLKFSEVYFRDPEKKIFDIGFDKRPVLKNIDIFGSVGDYFPLDVFIEFDIKNNVVLFNGNPIKSAITSKGNLLVKLLKGAIDNPKINAILLVKGTLNDTDYDEYQKLFAIQNKLINMPNGSGQRIQHNRIIHTESYLQKEIYEFINDYQNGFHGYGAVVMLFLIFFFILLNKVFYSKYPRMNL